jgi:hypothetical protein
MTSFPELDPFLDQIAHLTTYAVESRYPTDEPEPLLSEATQNLQLAEHFVKEISNLIQLMVK